MTKITAAICTHNRYSLLKKAINSLLGQSMRSKEYEILVIDNSSKNTVADKVAGEMRAHRNVNYIRTGEIGIAAARNIALDSSQSELLAFIDDDNIAEPDWLYHCYDSFVRYPNCDIVGGKVVPRWEVKKPEWLSDELLGYLSLIDWGGECRRVSGNEWICGNNICYRKRTLRELGGFDERLGRTRSELNLMSNEEIDVINRAMRLGGQVFYQPNAVVSHFIPISRCKQAWFRRRAAWQAVSDFMMDPERTVGKVKSVHGSCAELLTEVGAELEIFSDVWINVSDKDRFKAALNAIYNLQVLILSEV